MELNDDALPDYVQVINGNESSPGREAWREVVVGGPWTEGVSDFVSRNAIEILTLNSAKGWCTFDYNFLCKLRGVKKLVVISSSATGLSAIENMDSLEEVSITTSTKDVVDFGKLSNLKKCYLYWWKGAESILECAGLSEAYFDKIKLADFSLLNKLKGLKVLTIANSQLEDLEWLFSFSNLRSLEVLNCKKIKNFEPISRLSTLEKLSIRGCKQLGNLDFIDGLSSLEVLVTSDCGSIDSISPMTNLVNLKAFSFSGNTNVEDGDLSVLEGLPNLAMLMFQGRRHYSHKLIKKWNWDNFNFPSKLLERK